MDRVRRPRRDHPARPRPCPAATRPVPSAAPGAVGDQHHPCGLAERRGRGHRPQPHHRGLDERGPAGSGRRAAPPGGVDHHRHGSHHRHRPGLRHRGRRALRRTPQLDRGGRRRPGRRVVAAARRVDRDLPAVAGCATVDQHRDRPRLHRHPAGARGDRQGGLRGRLDEHPPPRRRPHHRPGGQPAADPGQGHPLPAGVDLGPHPQTAAVAQPAAATGRDDRVDPGRQRRCRQRPTARARRRRLHPLARQRRRVAHGEQHQQDGAQRTLGEGQRQLLDGQLLRRLRTPGRHRDQRPQPSGARRAAAPAAAPLPAAHREAARADQPARQLPQLGAHRGHRHLAR